MIGDFKDKIGFRKTLGVSKDNLRGFSAKMCNNVVTEPHSQGWL